MKWQMAMTELTDWQRKVEMALDSCVKAAHLVTYQELAQTADIPAPHRIHKLTLFLEEVIKADIAANRPIRAACVISKIRGLPAPGFFHLLERFDFDCENNKATHQKLLAELF